jgi:hypothetical protein
VTPTTLSPAARVKAEGPVPLTEAALLFRADTPTGHVGIKTLLRWIVGGKAGVRLEAARIKGQWFTSYAAAQRFKAATGA